MIPVIYGYARVSKSDDEAKNLATQVQELEAYGIRYELIHRDSSSGRSFNRPGWIALLERLQPGDTIVVCYLDRFSRNFEEGIAMQTRLLTNDINVVAIREDIDTRDENAGAKFFRRVMLATGSLQVESAIERIRAGQQRAKAEGRHIGRKPALTPEQVQQCKRMADEGYSPPQIARVFNASPNTIRKWLKAG